MEFNFRKTTMEEAEKTYEEYTKTLTGVVDEFWEEHILKGDKYLIMKETEVCGCFSVRRLWNDDNYITSFYVKVQYYPQAHSIIKRIIEEFSIHRAMVATCDELFLGLCMDLHKKIELQAYFFDGTEQHPVREVEYKRECVKEVKEEELSEMRDLTDDFFEDYTDEQFVSRSVLLYKLEQKGEPLGYGMIVPNKIQKGYWACGMITIEKNRGKGVGRSLQYHMGDICREHGVKPISGCWYYNNLSKKTIESAGRYSKTRLLNMVLVDR